MEEAALGVDLLHHDVEGVPGPRVPVEVHVPGHHVAEEDRERRRLTGLVHGLVEAALEHPVDRDHPGLGLHLPRVADEVVAVALDAVAGQGRGLVVEEGHLAGGGGLHPEGLARAGVAEVEGALEGADDVVDLRGGEAGAGQRRGDGAPALEVPGDDLVGHGAVGGGGQGGALDLGDGGTRLGGGGARGGAGAGRGGRGGRRGLGHQRRGGHLGAGGVPAVAPMDRHQVPGGDAGEDEGHQVPPPSRGPAGVLVLEELLLRRGLDWVHLGGRPRLRVQQGATAANHPISAPPGALQETRRGRTPPGFRTRARGDPLGPSP